MNMTLIEFALIAQLAVCNSATLSPETIEVHEYRAPVDWQEVEDAKKNYDATKPRIPNNDGGWMDFVFSKAKIKQDKLHIQVFQPLSDDGEPLAEAWMKLRHPDALDEVFACESKVTSNFSGAITAAIQSTQGESQLANLKLQDKTGKSGPDWLEAAIAKETIANETITTVPVGLSSPNAPKRFAGVLYIKLPLM